MAARPIEKPEGEKTLNVGDSIIIECKNVTRAAVGDPVIADVVPISSKEILVNGKSPGRTVIYIWDDMGRAYLGLKSKRQR